jgi:hypothetical protein
LITALAGMLHGPHLSREHAGQPVHLTGAMMEIDSSEWGPTREGVSRLNSDHDFLKDALQSWRSWSHHLLREIKRVAFRREKPHGQEIENQPLTFEVPESFNRLTDLFVLWCDTSRTSIHADPLLQFRDTVYMFSFGQRPRQSYEEIHRVLLHSHRLLRRIRLVASMLPVEQPGGSGAEGGDEGCGDGKGGKGDDEENRNPKDEVKGVFGLSVNMTERRIWREGYEKGVCLESHTTLWHIFCILFRAGKQQAGLEQLEAKYPGEWNSNARNQAYHDLRSKLRPLGITVQNRRLVPITDA